MDSPPTLNLPGIRVSLQGPLLVIEKDKKRNLLVLVLGIIFMVFFTVPTVLIDALATIQNILFITGLNAIIIAIIWSQNSSGIYYQKVLDLHRMQMIQKSKYQSLFKDKVLQFKRVDEIGVSTKAVGGGTSAYEEGNTDYRKRIYLNTDQGEIVLLAYYSREEALEKPTYKLTAFLNKRLIPSTVQ
jgi:hypothetical protein